jgi:hypothetical protein
MLGVGQPDSTSANRCDLLCPDICMKGRPEPGFLNFEMAALVLL